MAWRHILLWVRKIYKNICVGIIVGWRSNWERDSCTIESGNWNSHLWSRATSSVFHPFHAAGSYRRFRWPWEICWRWGTQHRRCYSRRQRLQRSTWSRFRYLTFETNNVVQFRSSYSNIYRRVTFVGLFFRSFVWIHES